MRLFIGIGLPPSVSEALAHAARSLIASPTPPRPSISWTPPENMHLTLSFLGQVDPARLDNIKQALAKLQSPRLHLQLNGPGSFPNAGILYAHVKPAPDLLSFAGQVSRSMEECGFPHEQRPYAPHITLARINARINAASRPAAKDASTYPRANRAAPPSGRHLKRTNSVSTKASPTHKASNTGYSAHFHFSDRLP